MQLREEYTGIPRRVESNQKVQNVVKESAMFETPKTDTNVFEESGSTKIIADNPYMSSSQERL